MRLVNILRNIKVNKKKYYCDINHNNIIKIKIEKIGVVEFLYSFFTKVLPRPWFPYERQYFPEVHQNSFLLQIAHRNHLL